LKKNPKLKTMIKDMQSYLDRVSPDDTVCLIHHDDADGCTSAALFSIIIKRLSGINPILFPVRGTGNVNKSMINRLKTLNPDFVFTLDIPLKPRRIGLFRGFVLDHHIFDEIRPTSSILYFNPRVFEKEDNKVVPVSYITYRLLNEMFPEEKVSWIAAIGVTGDHRVELCSDVFDDLKKEYPELFNLKEITQNNVENSIFGKFWDMIRSGRMVKKMEGARTAVLALLECKNDPDKLLNGLTQHSSALRKFYDKVSYATEGFLINIRDKAEFHNDKKVVIYKAKKSSISALTSFIADKIRQKYPEWIVVVVGGESRGKDKNISIRLEQTRRDDNLASLVKKLEEKVPTVSGGGHKAAVGASVSPEFLDEFLRTLVSLV